MQKRSLPPQSIHRFNYWELFRPGGLRRIAPLKQHIQHQFNLLLNATPAVWNKEVRPWLHKNVSTIRNRPLYALKYYVEHDKEWGSDKTAQAVLKQLSSRQKAAILRHFRTTWPERSKRPARLMRTWKTLLESIAGDQESFLKYLERMPDDRAVSEATKQRIYQHYSQQAIYLLGGGSYIQTERRKIYRDILDGSDLLDEGRLPSRSIFPVDWLNCKSNDERREAKKRTLHWFHHALRNLREYRNRRDLIPWTAECEKQCRRSQQKLLNS